MKLISGNGFKEEQRHMTGCIVGLQREEIV